MKTIRNYVLATVALVPGLAQAHAHLQMSIPAAGSSIAVMPAQIMLHFSEAVKMTVATIEREGATDKVELKVAADAMAVNQIAAPKLSPGVYLLNWRGLGKDGHVMKGTVRFTVTGK